MVRASGHVWRGRRMPSALDILIRNGPIASNVAGNTLLVGWELGGGRGHVEHLVPVVNAWLDQGWRVTVALRDAPLVDRTTMK